MPNNTSYAMIAYAMIEERLTNKQYIHPLHLSIVTRNIASLQIALNNPKVDINCVDSNGNTPLMLAVQYESITAIHMLLKRGAIVSAPMIPTVSSVRDVDCIYLLLSHWILQSNWQPDQVNAIQKYIQHTDLDREVLKYCLLNKMQSVIKISYSDEKLKLLAKSAGLSEDSTQEVVLSNIHSKVENLLRDIPFNNEYMGMAV